IPTIILAGSLGAQWKTGAGARLGRVGRAVTGYSPGGYPRVPESGSRLRQECLVSLSRLHTSSEYRTCVALPVKVTESQRDCTGSKSKTTARLRSITCVRLRQDEAGVMAERVYRSQVTS